MTENSKQDANVVGGRSSSVEQLRAWDKNAIEEVIEYRGETTIVVPREVLRATAERCRDDASMQFNLLTDATCLDRHPFEPRFEVVYQLVCISRREKLRLKVRLSGKDPVVDSLVPVWPGANWLEREIFDLFGIHFNGHPDLRRIVLPDDWEGYPLRRDYPVEGYRDIPAMPTGFTKTLHMTTVETAVGQAKTMVLNMGPQHPSTHGVLRILLELDGETVVKAVPDLRISAYRDREILRRQDVFAGDYADRPDGLFESAGK